MPSLFRPEVIEGRRQNWLGSIQLVRPVSLTVLTAFVVITALLVGAFLFASEYTRKARVSGYLVPEHDVGRVAPEISAIVEERHVVEGQYVLKGELMFTLARDHGSDSSSRVLGSLTSREGSLRASRQQREQELRAEGVKLNDQIEHKRREIANFDQQIKLKRDRLLAAEKEAADYRALQRDNFMPAVQVRAKEDAANDLRGQVAELEGLRLERQTQVATLQAQLNALPLQLQREQAEIDRNLAALTQERAENKTLQGLKIVAPRDGVVTALMADVGQRVSPSVAVASLVPAQAKLQAHLFAPSSAVGFVRPQQPVLLRYQAFPYQKFGLQRGQVLQVSRTPLQAAELASLSLPPSAEPLYRITVALDRQSVIAYDQPQALVSGMQLDADVLLDRRRLIEWIFEPLLSLAGRV